MAAAFAVGVTVFAQSAPPDLAFDANADLLQFPAYGEVAGVATDSMGNIYVYMRTGMPSPRSATSGPSITAIRGSSSSTRPESS